MHPLLLFFSGVQGVPLLQNITIPLPKGTSDHGTPGLLCTPAGWTDIVIFYLANYAAHAATTRSLPGEHASSLAIIIFTALLFPAAGAFRGLLGITSLAIFGKTDLEKAAKAGALCMVVRTCEWKPQDGDVLRNTILSLLSPPTPSDQVQETSLAALPNGVEKVQTTNQVTLGQNPTRFAMYYLPLIDESEFTNGNIHGYFRLPPGYGFEVVPRNAVFIEPSIESETIQNVRLSYNYSSVKILVSLGQAIYATFTLYHTKGDQIAQFGYAAFGLTVAPYATVSILNLLGSLLCPEFPTLYMVESSVMEEARRRGSDYVFEGTVGRLDEHMIQRCTNIISPDDQQSIRWVSDPVIVKIGAGGGFEFAIDPQHEISPEKSQGENRTSEGATETTDGEPLYVTNNIQISTGSTSEIVSRPAAETTKASQPSNIQFSPSSNHTPESILLVPFANPLKRKGQSPLSENYSLYSAIPSKDLETPWRVDMGRDDFSYLPNDWSSITSLFSFLVTLIPVAIIGTLTRFHKGHSTHAQRIWTMAWLSFGAAGPFYAFYLPKVAVIVGGGIMSKLVFLYLVLFYSAPAIGGFVVVGQMLKFYGNCVTVS